MPALSMSYHTHGDTSLVVLHEIRDSATPQLSLKHGYLMWAGLQQLGDLAT